MRKIKTLIANWRAERRRVRELRQRLDALTDYGLLDRILNPDAPQQLTLAGNMLRYNTTRVAKVQ